MERSRATTTSRQRAPMSRPCCPPSSPKRPCKPPAVTAAAQWGGPAWREGFLGCLWALLPPCLAQRGWWQLVCVPHVGVTAPPSTTLFGGACRGARSLATARTWASAQLLSEPGARHRGSWDACQALNPRSPCGMAECPSASSCVLRSPGYGPARVAGGCRPKPPALCAASVCVCPGAVAGKRSWVFPSRQAPAPAWHAPVQPVQPRCKFGLVTALRCSFWGAGGCCSPGRPHLGLPQMGRGLEGSDEPAAGPAVLCLRSNIIDVSAADSQGMEQHEYMDRARQYRWDLPCSLGALAAPQRITDP